MRSLLGLLVSRDVIRIVTDSEPLNSRSEYRCGRPLISGLIKHCPRSETRPLNTKFA